MRSTPSGIATTRKPRRKIWSSAAGTVFDVSGTEPQAIIFEWAVERRRDRVYSEGVLVASAKEARILAAWLTRWADWADSTPGGES